LYIRPLNISACEHDIANINNRLAASAWSLAVNSVDIFRMRQNLHDRLTYWTILKGVQDGIQKKIEVWDENQNVRDVTSKVKFVAH